ncbi:transmembrane protein 70, mitochondrial-like [Ptychodera flava]|uniref:transmembrane protein 70, mitochondrial-like n=1 Tax=Ptychodera flava TaxID=63121 RepID=UPI00396A2F6B
MVCGISARMFGKRILLERHIVSNLKTQALVGRCHLSVCILRHPGLLPPATRCYSSTKSLQWPLRTPTYRINQQIRYIQQNNVIRKASSLSQDAGQSSDKGQLVYQGPATSIVRGVKFFSLSTSVITLAILPWFFMEAGNEFMKVFGGALSAVVFITPVMLHILARSYVTKMYYNSVRDTFTAVTFTLFLRNRFTEFTADDVEIPGVTNLLTTFKVKGQSLLVDPNAFPNPNDYNHLMGYDKYERINMEELMKKVDGPKDI